MTDADRIVAATVAAVDTDMRNIGASPECRAACSESVEKNVRKALDTLAAMLDNDSLT